MHLVHAAAVRAIVAAAEEGEAAKETTDEARLAHYRHQAEMAAELQGNVLGAWT